MLRRIILHHPAASAIVAVTLFATAFALFMPGLHSPEVTVSFVVVIALSLAGIIIDPKPYSLCQIFCLFCLVFMGVAPLYLYIIGYMAWGTVPFGKSAFLGANMLVIVCLLVFLACAYYRRPEPKSPLSLPESDIAGNPASGIFLVAMAALATLIVLWYYRHTPLYLFKRFDGTIKYNGTSQVGVLLVNVFLRSIPPLCLTVSLMQRKRTWWVITLTAILTLVASFPTAIPRYQLAAVFMPAGIMLIPLLRRAKVLTLCIMVLFVTIFPLLNLARVHDYYTPYTFAGADFDAYQNLLTLMQADIVTYGKQLLGVVLFFVPRSIWPDKPIGSGFEVANDLHLIYSNISMPIFGEGYINFGIVGAIAFTAVVALVFRRLDVRYDFRNMNLSTLLYLLILGECIYLLRGALMPAFASLCGFISAALIVYLPARAFGRGKPKSPPDDDN